MKKTLFLLLVLGILVSPAVSFASFDTNLKYGSRGESVKELQDFLQDQGVYSGKIDGKFGLGTRKAVIAFQSANNLRADGFFGPISRTKASAVLSVAVASSDAQEQAETGTVVPPVKEVNPDTQALLDKISALNAKVDAQTKVQEQIAQNTTPAQVKPEPVVDTTPKEVTTKEINSWVGTDTIYATHTLLFSTGSREGDIVTITLNGNTQTKKVESTSGKNSVGIGFTFSNLSPETSYPITYKIQRGYEYVLGSFNIKTDLGFKCDRDTSTSCTNFFSKSIEVTKIKANILIPYVQTMGGGYYPKSVSCKVDWGNDSMLKTLDNQNSADYLPIEFSTSITIPSNSTLNITPICSSVPGTTSLPQYSGIEYEWHLVN